ncbi:MAG: esterase, partial [Saprospiraceae bacterium]
MSKYLTLLLLGLACAQVALGQLPQVSSGRIVRHENFASRHVPPRHVDVWLPDGYSPRQKYPVVYMHHGPMGFDRSPPWNPHG